MGSRIFVSASLPGAGPTVPLQAANINAAATTTNTVRFMINLPLPHELTDDWIHLVT